MSKQRDYFYSYRLTEDMDPTTLDAYKQIQEQLTKGCVVLKFEQAVEQGATTVIVHLRDVSSS